MYDLEHPDISAMLRTGEPPGRLRYIQCPCCENKIHPDDRIFECEFMDKRAVQLVCEECCKEELDAQWGEMSTEQKADLMLTPYFRVIEAMDQPPKK